MTCLYRASILFMSFKKAIILFLFSFYPISPVYFLKGGGFTFLCVNFVASHLTELSLVSVFH